MNPNLDISIVVPVYRSQDNLLELYQRIKAVLLSEQMSFEILFVEDCGGDNSWEIIKSIAAEDSHVRGLRMSRNYGQHNALLAGIREARGVFTLTLDDDLQHPPEEIPTLLSCIQGGFDVVYGAPEYQRHGLFRDLASLVAKIALQSAMGAETARQISAFRVFRTELRKAFERYGSPSVNIDVLLTWATNRFSAITVKHYQRKNGESGYSIRKLVRHTMNMMTGFSTLPLKIASIIGFIFAFFGLFVLLYVLTRYFFSGDSVPGFPFLASIIAIFSGAQLLALGLIGEYLARMYQRTMERPVYHVIEETKTM